MVNDMDKMFVRVPVAIKAKVTEDLKLKIIGDVQNTIKTINLDIEHFEQKSEIVPETVRLQAVGAA